MTDTPYMVLVYERRELQQERHAPCLAAWLRIFAPSPSIARNRTEFLSKAGRSPAGPVPYEYPAFGRPDPVAVCAVRVSAGDLT